MHIPIVPLAVDWVELLIFLFIVGSSLFGKLMQANRDMQRKQRRAPQPPGPGEPPRRGPTVVIQKPGQPRQIQPGAGRERPPVDPNSPQAQLEEEIEAFLRKTTGKSTPSRSSSTPPRPKPTPPKLAPPRTQKPRQPLSDFPRSESVSQHVERHISSGGVANRDAHLGDNIELADERIEDHLRGVFDHQVGRLSKSSTADVREGTDADVWQRRDPSSPLADTMFDMLSSPQEVGAAIVLAEILKRPEL